jgi:hypothetical protein
VKYAAIAFFVLGVGLFCVALFSAGRKQDDRHRRWCQQTLALAPTASDSFQFMMRNPRCQP